MCVGGAGGGMGAPDALTQLMHSQVKVSVETFPIWQCVSKALKLCPFASNSLSSYLS